MTHRKVHAQQVPTEINWLQNQIASIYPRNILELGTAEGGSFVRWMELRSVQLLISIDFNVGNIYPSDDKKVLERLCQEFEHNNEIKTHFITADSKEKQTIERVEEILDGEKLDFLFIDGDHSYEGAKADYNAYKKFVRSGGYIGFHDVLPSRWSKDNGIFVSDLWNELKTAHDHDECTCKDESFYVWPGSRPHGAGGVGIIVND